jgi:hypothetical protein
MKIYQKHLTVYSILKQLWVSFCLTGNIRLGFKNFKWPNTLAYYCPAFRDEDKSYNIDTRSHDKKLFSLSLTVGQNKINCLYLVSENDLAYLSLASRTKKLTLIILKLMPVFKV